MPLWKTVTVASSGGDYTSLNSTLGGEAKDITVEIGDLLILLENFSDITQVTTVGQNWTTDPTHRVLIQAADNHNGKWSTSVYRLEVQGTAFRNETIDDLEITGIQIREHGTGSNSRCFHYQIGLSSGTQILEKFIFIQDHQDSADNVVALEIDDSSPTYKIRNGVIYGNLAGSNVLIGMRVDASTATVYFDNIAIDSVDTGISLSSPNVRLRNTRITAVTTVKAGGSNLHSASDFNLTDGTGPTNWGGNSIDSGDSPTIDYIDDTNSTLKSRDYRLDSSSDSGYEVGTDLTSDSNNPFSDDIGGIARSDPWDIGPHELSAAAGDLVKVIDEIMEY